MSLWFRTSFTSGPNTSRRTLLEPLQTEDHCTTWDHKNPILQLHVLELGRLFPKFCLLCFSDSFNYPLNFQNCLVTKPAKNNFTTSSSWDLSSNFAPTYIVSNSPYYVVFPNLFQKIHPGLTSTAYRYMTITVLLCQLKQQQLNTHEQVHNLAVVQLLLNHTCTIATNCNNEI